MFTVRFLIDTEDVFKNVFISRLLRNLNIFYTVSIIYSFTLFFITKHSYKKIKVFESLLLLKLHLCIEANKKKNKNLKIYKTKKYKTYKGRTMTCLWTLFMLLKFDSKALKRFINF